MSVAEVWPDDDYEYTDADAPSGIARVAHLGDHVELARWVVADHGGSDLVYDEGRFWTYAPNGLWPEVDRAELSRTVQSYSGTPTKPNDKPLRVKSADVSGAIRLAQDRASRAGFFADAPAGVAFENGFLRVSDVGARLEPISREHRARHGYPFAYEAGACPRLYLGFLEALHRDDPDRFEKISFAQEFFGGCLIGRATEFQRATIAIGTAAENGKSTEANIMIGVMPKGTTSAIPPQDFHQEYRRAMLAGIRLNAPGELPERDIIESEPFKAIIAGDVIIGRPIREAPVAIRPIAGHFFPANTLPGTTDQTEGFWRRFVVRTYNRSFKGDPSRDRHIATKILASERQAIVSWLIDGAVRLLRQGDYTIPPSHFDALNRWRKNANQVALFVDSEMRRVDREATPAADVYEAYVRWAERNRHRPMASNTFGQRMSLLGLESKKTKTGWKYPLVFLTAADRAAGDAGDELVTSHMSPNSQGVARA